MRHTGEKFRFDMGCLGPGGLTGTCLLGPAAPAHLAGPAESRPSHLGETRPSHLGQASPAAGASAFADLANLAAGTLVKKWTLDVMKKEIKANQNVALAQATGQTAVGLEAEKNRADVESARAAGYGYIAGALAAAVVAATGMYLVFK